MHLVGEHNNFHNEPESGQSAACSPPTPSSHSTDQTLPPRFSKVMKTCFRRGRGGHQQEEVRTGGPEGGQGGGRVT